MSTTLVAPTATMATTSTSATPTAVPNQEGILNHGNPSVYDPKNPITVFIIQAAIIIIFCRMLHFPLSRLRQPRVIAEVIGGILLGPSVFGRIPGFTHAIFPPESMPNLNVVANLGLVFFLFLVGLEVDLRFLVSNWRIALGVGAAGMALPFGLGAAIAWGLYNQFPTDKNIGFGVYLLFIGVAMAITAFPVLCRILTELKLLRTPVGVIVLSAGVGNDVVGWVLLALCVALVNAGSGITALYVLLVATGYSLFIGFLVRPSFLWVLRKTGSLQNGPSQSIVALTVLLVLASAFFTSIIGVHAIFGAFMIGLICPHEGGFAIKLTEKLEDVICALFVPLYFALSGLSTNLGLLNNGITWAYVVGVIAVAFCAKVIGGCLAARLGGLVWRESLTVGAMMSCKGLVELIVLNIGLQANILSPTTFTIFVVMALVTTLATTPLVSWLYPPWYQVKIEAWKRGEIEWDGKPGSTDESPDLDQLKEEQTEVFKLIANLRLDSMSGVIALVSLLTKSNSDATPKVHPTKKEAIKAAATADSTPTIDHRSSSETDEETAEKATLARRRRPFTVDGVRLTELTERSSSVMKVTELEEYSQGDPVLNTFRTFGQLSNTPMTGTVFLSPVESYASTLVERARGGNADLMLLPWSATGAISENGADVVSQRLAITDRFANGSFGKFISDTLHDASGLRSCNVAVFVDNGFGSGRRGSGVRPSLSRTVSALSAREMVIRADTVSIPIVDQGHHIFVPYFGGADDKLALRIALQLARDPSVTATIVRFDRNATLPLQTQPHSGLVAAATSTLTATSTNTTAADVPAEEGAGSTTAYENNKSAATATVSPLPLTRPVTPAYAPQDEDANFFASMRDSLHAALASRVIFEVETVPESTTPIAAVVSRAAEEVGKSPKNAGDLIILGRSAGLATFGYSSVTSGNGNGANGKRVVSTRNDEDEDDDGEGGSGSSEGKGITAAAWAELQAGKTLGPAAGALISAHVKASFLVLKAPAPRTEKS